MPHKPSVHSLRELPLLFITEEERTKIMGYPRKHIPELLNKLVQFVWYYGQQHGGVMPGRDAIANELNVHPTMAGDYVDRLVNQGRMEKISSRPYRIRLLEHPQNRAAIRRLEKALAAADALEAKANERPQEDAPQPDPAAQHDLRIESDLPAPTPIIRAAVTSPHLLSPVETIDTRDLIFELLNRGYAISKR